MLRQGKFDTSDATLNYVEGPDTGEPLVLLHGGGSRWQTWLPVIPSLIPRWHVLAVDQRGHGESSRTPGRYAIADYAEDTAEFLEKVAGRPSILVGHSMGGMIALTVASTWPQIVRALVLEDTPLYVATEPPEEPVRKAAKEMRDILGTARSADDLMPILALRNPEMEPAVVRDLAATLIRVDPGLFTSNAEGKPPWDCDLDALLDNVNCPVLVIEADPSRSPWSRDGDWTRASKHLKTARRLRLSGVSHEIHRIDQSRFSSMVGEFLNTL